MLGRGEKLKLLTITKQKFMEDLCRIIQDYTHTIQKFLKINVHPGHSHTTQQEVELKQQITFQIGKIHNNDICLSLVLTC